MTRRTGRLGAVVAVTTLMAGFLAIIISSPPAQANHGGATLEVEREVSSTTGASIVLTAKLTPSDPTSPPASVNIDFEVEGGPADAEGGAITRAVPDYTCTTSALPAVGVAPSCQVTVTHPGGTGTSLIRAWIDHDQTSSDESDPTEGRNAGTSDCTSELPAPAGSGASDRSNYNDCSAGTVDAGQNTSEPDNTDVVSVTFNNSGLAANRLDCDEENFVKTAADGFVNCTVTDSSGAGRSGVLVDAEHISGANDPNGDNNPPAVDSDANPPGAGAADYGSGTDASACTSSPAGNCRVKITAGPDRGLAQICAWIDSDSHADNDLPSGAPTRDISWNPTGIAGDGGNCATEATSGDAAGAPNDTDKAHITWADPTMTSLDVTPEGATSATGTTHTLTATVLDQFGDPFNATTTVNFEFFAQSPNDRGVIGNTPNEPDLQCVTQQGGSPAATCSASYTGNAGGADEICAWFGATPTMSGVSSSGTCDGESPAGGSNVPRIDVVTKTWTTAGATTTSTTAAPPSNQGQGYSLVGEDGSLYAFGTAKNVGDMRGQKLNAPIVSVAYTPGGNGYWLVATDGGIFSFGNAEQRFYGSMGDKKINSPIIGIAATPSGFGYWLFAADGGIFSFGDAEQHFYGSMGDQKLNAPVINMEPLANGLGYWLVAGDGGIFSFGDATNHFYGSMGDKKLNAPVFDMTSTDTSNGYWLVARDGGIFSFGDAEQKFYGSGADASPPVSKVIGMAATPNTQGYWIADATGRVLRFGNALHLGDRSSSQNPAPMIAFAAVPK